MTLDLSAFKPAPGGAGDANQIASALTAIETWAAGIETEIDDLPGGSTDLETGDYIVSARTSVTGALLCDGSAVSRATYADLFSEIGTTYGVGNGSTTFNLPDFAGRALVGKGTHADVNSLADNDGIADVSHRSPRHNSTNNVTATIGSKPVPGTGTGGPWVAQGDQDLAELTVDVAGTIGPGGTLPVDMPAYAVLNVFIKT